ncbi:MAG: phosphorylase family protein [Acidiferrobacteraceae bacterium]
MLIGAGLVVALPTEAKTLTWSPPAVGAMECLGSGAWLALSGIGAAQARAAARRLCASGVSGLISWGVCGALAPALLAGALVIPERVQGSDGRLYETTGVWRERLCDRISAPFHTGLMIESAEMVTSLSAKESLYRRFGAIAVDMETAAVAEVALEAGLPFVAIRAVVDVAQMAIPEGFTRVVDAAGTLHLAQIPRAMGLRRSDWFALIHLATGFRAARRTLARVAVEAENMLAAGALRTD